ncbi:MAG: hypothetical protein MZU97_07240 [Bacillus subtilis]|nr:hypothetical protein [Bacillus subtilis]
MDAQTNSFWNGLTDRDVVYLDSWIRAEDLGNDIRSDFRAADLILQIVSGEAGNFIVLNKRGVHFLYEDSYPPETGIWGPVPGEYTSQPELVKDPYDNGVRYNVNTFLKGCYLTWRCSNIRPFSIQPITARPCLRTAPVGRIAITHRRKPWSL